ncbi:hypothetical protein OAI87_00285 [Paracoccaceae bacterium]|nr:hypothetical protein [Paracoccaceae bacterium]
MRKKIELVIKNHVLFFGERAIEDPFLTQLLTVKELESLIEIVQNPEHPFMKEHKLRGEECEKDLIENHLKNLDEMKLQNEERKQIESQKNKKSWNQKSAFKKFFWYTSRTVIWVLIIFFITFVLLTLPGKILF